jgi:GntR family transcriptional regulator/MocR family aminotransferase
VTARLRRQVDLALLGRLARRVDVGLYTIDVFFHEAAPFQALFFGFGAIDSVDIDTALDRVHQILVELDAPPGARLAPPIS